MIVNQREGRGCILGTTPWRCTALLAWVLQHREFTVTTDCVSFLSPSLITSAKPHRTDGCDAFLPLTFFFHSPLPRNGEKKKKTNSWQPVVLQFGDVCLSLGEVCWKKKTTHSATGTVITDLGRASRSGLVTLERSAAAITNPTTSPQKSHPSDVRRVADSSLSIVSRRRSSRSSPTDLNTKKKKTHKNTHHLTTHSAPGAVRTNLGRASRSGLVTLERVPPPQLPSQPQAVKNFILRTCVVRRTRRFR